MLHSGSKWASWLYRWLRAEKETYVVVASLVVRCAMKNVTVASQLYVVADVQFTVEKEGPLELLQFIQKCNLGNSVRNMVIMLGFSSQLPLVLLPVRGVFRK